MVAKSRNILISGLVRYYMMNKRTILTISIGSIFGAFAIVMIILVLQSMG